MRALSGAFSLRPEVATVRIADLVIEPHPVTRTSHQTWGLPAAADGVSGVGTGVLDVPGAAPTGWPRGADQH